MIFKKPKFWDYKKPNYLSYLLFPLTVVIKLNNLFKKFNKNKKKEKIKTICIGNIYVGGTGKTPLVLKIEKILRDLNFNVATIKKYYKDQIDEQKLLAKRTKLYCSKKRVNALDDAIKDNIDVAIFDDGLQDTSINYDLKFVCFNTEKWIGNNHLIPAGPLRENIETIKNYHAVFLNGNGENVSEIKKKIKNYNENIKIFEADYQIRNIEKFDTNEKYLIFSGIGNPDSFFKTLKKHNFNIVKEIRFPDHYNYSSRDLDEIKEVAKSLNVKMLTTEKDYIKINNADVVGIDCLKIDLIIKEESELKKFIKLGL
tara:strand:- start:416 stop:1354 length:939 start_codon:yes stop_codon:yes gene_type:complete